MENTQTVLRYVTLADNVEEEKSAVKALSALREAGKTVFTAESCTGGFIAKLLTDIPGSSEAVLGGIVTYTNDMKIGILGVNPETIGKYTEVSEQTAKEMAVCAKRLSKSDVVVSSTGFAGPGGGSDIHPVGTVFVAVAYDGGCEVIELHIDGSRDRVRKAAADTALRLIIKAAKKTD